MWIQTVQVWIWLNCISGSTAYQLYNLSAVFLSRGTMATVSHAGDSSLLGRIVPDAAGHLPSLPHSPSTACQPCLQSLRGGQQIPTFPTAPCLRHKLNSLSLRFYLGIIPVLPPKKWFGRSKWATSPYKLKWYLYTNDIILIHLGSLPVRGGPGAGPTTRIPGRIYSTVLAVQSCTRIYNSYLLCKCFRFISGKFWFISVAADKNYATTWILDGRLMADT